MCSGPEAGSLLIFRLGGQYCWNSLMTVMGLSQWRLKYVCMCIIQCFLLFPDLLAHISPACLHLIRHFHLFRLPISRQLFVVRIPRCVGTCQWDPDEISNMKGMCCHLRISFYWKNISKKKKNGNVTTVWCNWYLMSCCATLCLAVGLTLSMKTFWYCN